VTGIKHNKIQKQLAMVYTIHRFSEDINIAKSINQSANQSIKVNEKNDNEELS